MHGELTKSVIAVPPLARHQDLSLNHSANTALIRHLEEGGVSTLMYGGNANFYNVSIGEYGKILDMLLKAAAGSTWIIPAIGPDFGKMMDQADILRSSPCPTPMVLPASGIFTVAGVADGIARVAERLGRPVIVYLRAENYLTPEAVASLFAAGVVTAVKYAIVREDPRQDAYLERLMSMVDSSRIISGMGEGPALVHWRQFGLRAFTSGSVSIAPKSSTAILDALKAGDFGKAERLREAFLPFERLRDSINPIRVLHDGVSLSGVADMGPILPLLSPLDASERSLVEPAARDLLRLNGAMEAEAVA
ncbi:dihydrodipicolinate synthase/N-acetylneuraminate lyase [Rhodoligotrophos appendicifer]|uniref:dihydrodipicolinate synthase family protein n=1 Tax=Rhodoligotrophos appendicifer TaxID=987056 RepID=UPI001185C899|nr:dihydrodipicolinate synthase family protein [Rhodoligotrophos appendicifer]